MYKSLQARIIIRKKYITNVNRKKIISAEKALDILWIRW